MFSIIFGLFFVIAAAADMFMEMAGKEGMNRKMRLFSLLAGLLLLFVIRPYEFNVSRDWDPNRYDDVSIGPGQYKVFDKINNKPFTDCIKNTSQEKKSNKKLPLTEENAFICRYVITDQENREDKALGYLEQISVKNVSEKDMSFVTRRADLAEKYFRKGETPFKTLLYENGSTKLVFSIAKDCFGSYTLYAVKPNPDKEVMANSDAKQSASISSEQVGRNKSWFHPSYVVRRYYVRDKEEELWALERYFVPNWDRSAQAARIIRDQTALAGHLMSEDESIIKTYLSSRKATKGAVFIMTQNKDNECFLYVAGEGPSELTPYEYYDISQV